MDEQLLQQHIHEFYEQGFTLIKQAINDEQVEEIKRGVLEAFAGPEGLYGSILRTLMFERGEVFERLIEQPGIVDIDERVLGTNCHMIAMTSINTPKNTGIDTWHVDEDLFFPVAEGMYAHDPNIQITVFLFSCESIS